MSLDLFGVAALFWGLALLLAASCRSAVASRAALALGIVVALAGCAASALNDSRAAVPLFFWAPSSCAFASIPPPPGCSAGALWRP